MRFHTSDSTRALYYTRNKYYSIELKTANNDIVTFPKRDFHGYQFPKTIVQYALKYKPDNLFAILIENTIKQIENKSYGVK